MAEVTFTAAAIDDLRRIGPDAVPKVLKKILLLLDDAEAGYPLGGELTGFRKLVVGRNTWRIVYRIIDKKTIEVCAEAAARIRAADQVRPELVRLATVIDQLGRIAGGVAVERPAAREPVPA